MTITFEPLHESHFPLLLSWLEAPHIKKWWDQDVTYTIKLVHEKYSSYSKGYKLEGGVQKPIKGFIIHDLAVFLRQVLWECRKATDLPKF